MVSTKSMAAVSEAHSILHRSSLSLLSMSTLKTSLPSVSFRAWILAYMVCTSWIYPDLRPGACIKPPGCGGPLCCVVPSLPVGGCPKAQPPVLRFAGLRQFLRCHRRGLSYWRSSVTASIAASSSSLSVNGSPSSSQRFQLLAAISMQAQTSR